MFQTSKHSTSIAKRDWKLPAVCALFVAVGLLSLNTAIVYNPDSARYLVWATSLSHFQGFLDTSILEPFHYVVHAPIYSLLLAPLAFVFPDNVLAARVFTMLLGLLLLIVVFRWLTPALGRGFATIGCLVLALHPLMILFSNQILSEIPFAIVIVLVFILVGSDSQADKFNFNRSLILAGLLAAGVLLREVGITLWIAVVVLLLARREFQRALFVFLIPLMFYLLWYLRNEILVAGVEHPPLRNSEIFTLHYLTDRSDSLAAELLARFKTNISVYWKQIGNLVWLSQYQTVPYGVVNGSTPPYSIVARVAGAMGWIPLLGGMALFLYGLVISPKKSGPMPLFFTFIPFYLVLIFFYPFNDVRFLFPLLLVLLYCSIVGLHQLVAVVSTKLTKVPQTAITVVFLIALILPNAAWCFSYVRDNFSYRQDPREFYQSIAHNAVFPDMLTKPTFLVGSWLEEHGLGEATVLTQWKELTFWHGGHIVEMNSLVPLDEFERNIRDNRVEVVVSAIGLAGIPEFFSQMVLSNRYEFQSVFRVANLEVFQISSRDSSNHITPASIAPDAVSEQIRDLWSEQEQYRILFVRGLEALATNRIDLAGHVFDSLATLTNGASTMVLYLAIVHEFRNDFGPARQLLSGLQRMRQSGAFLGHSTYHQQIMDLLQSAELETGSIRRAELYHVASVKYWNIGFHKRAMTILDESLAADSAFPPALVFGVYYSIEEHDMSAAKSFLSRLKQSVPSHPLVEPFQMILAYEDSTSKRPPKAMWKYAEAKEYEKAGLGESAIDELLTSLEIDPSRLENWIYLAELYEAKGRFWPALQSVRQGIVLSPGNEKLRKMESDLSARW